MLDIILYNVFRILKKGKERKKKEKKRDQSSMMEQKL